MERYTKGDKVRVVMNEWVTDCGDQFHYFKLGEVVRIVRVTQDLIYCANSEGLNQALKPKHIKPIEKNT